MVHHVITSHALYFTYFAIIFLLVDGATQVKHWPSLQAPMKPYTKLQGKPYSYKAFQSTLMPLK